MSLLILASYSLVLLLIVAKRDLIGATSKRVFFAFLKYATPQNFCIFIGILFSLLVCLKAILLDGSGTVISSELVAPVDLSARGKEAIQAIIKNEKENNSECMALQNCRADVEAMNKRVFEDNLRYANSGSKSDNLTSRLIKDSLLIEADATWRGRYLHHYSTILFPYRQVKSGDISYLFTSQYGLVSLLPLFLMDHTSFTMYGVIGFISLLVFGLCVLFKSRGSFKKIIYAGSILFLIILSSDVGALRLSPGFAFFRYLPITILIYLYAHQLRPGEKVRYLLWSSLALLSAMQFNILLILICFVTFCINSAVKRRLQDLSTLRMPLCVLAIVIFQALLLYFQVNSFTPQIFSSVGEVIISRSYSFKLLMLPVILVLLYTLSSKNLISIERVASDELVYAYVALGLCATYAISFPRSPQHYAGFLLMAFFAIYIILYKLISSKTITVIAIAFLFYPAQHYLYLNLTRSNDVMSNFYEFKNQLGSPIYFTTALKIERLNSDYDDIVQPYIDTGKIYFISQDKIFIEALKGKNLDPQVYDIYTNLTNITPELALAKLKHEGASYLVLQIPELISYRKRLQGSIKGDFSREELVQHSKILANIESLSDALQKNLLRCNERYCIYKL